MIAKVSIVAMLCTLGPVHGSAKIVLPHFVTDSMVVQQNSRWNITGKSTGHEVNITPSWNGKTVKVATDVDGTFSAYINVPRAGGPYTIKFDDGTPLMLRDVYIGEVWLCSGQSNMEMPVGGWGKVMNYKAEIANANHPEVRLLQVKKQIGYSPATDTEVSMGGWRVCSPETVENFSSIGYFYAREMAKRLGVHVGVIDCTWGGTPAEAWSSRDGVASVAGFESELSLLGSADGDTEAMKKVFNRMNSEWTAKAKAMACNFDLSRYNENLPDMPVPGYWERSVLPDFNGIVYMQRRVRIPKEWVGKPLRLRLGIIDDEDVTYFNGVKIAEGSGYNVPRAYDVPAELVKEGETVITVMVTDYENEGGICGDESDLYLAYGDERLPLAGNWKYRAVVDFSKMPRRPVSPESSSFPTVLYNAMLHPLHTMPVKGVLWYQGCANVGRDVQYAPLFQRLITDWRKLWGNERLPFYFVQLAAYLQPQKVQPESKWAALREAQASALSLPKTNMAVAIDVGNPNDIHPKNKQEVARRLSLIALHDAYGQKDIVSNAPVLKSYRLNGQTAVLTFSGKIKTNGQPTGFVVRTADGKWTCPDAVAVHGDHKVKITTNGTISEIKYNWADYPDGNLRGVTGLPVAQFKVLSK